MRIAVMGAGALGCYFGGRLAAAGNDVAFIARGVHLDALCADGLRIESPLGDLHLPDITATDDPGEAGPVDTVLFLVKLYDTEQAAGAMARCWGRTLPWRRSRTASTVPGASAPSPAPSGPSRASRSFRRISPRPATCATVLPSHGRSSARRMAATANAAAACSPLRRRPAWTPRWCHHGQGFTGHLRGHHLRGHGIYGDMV